MGRAFTVTNAGTYSVTFYMLIGGYGGPLPIAVAVNNSTTSAPEFSGASPCEVEGWGCGGTLLVAATAGQPIALSTLVTHASAAIEPTISVGPSIQKSVT